MHDHGEPIPDRTAPQGTQADRLDHGHEGKDVEFGPLIKWFVGLFIGVGLTFPMVWYIYQGLSGIVSRGDTVASPMMTQRTNPPEPRMLPNRLDSPVDKVIGMPQPLQVPSEYYVQQRAIEEKKLDELQLRNEETGLASVPDAAVNAVLSTPEVTTAKVRAGTGIDGLTHASPAGYSGGTRMENQLR